MNTKPSATDRILAKRADQRLADAERDMRWFRDAVETMQPIAPPEVAKWLKAVLEKDRKRAKELQPET